MTADQLPQPKCSRRGGPCKEHIGHYTQGLMDRYWCLRCGIEWRKTGHALYAFNQTFPVRQDVDGRYMR